MICSRPGCITIIRSGRELCGGAGATYCRSAKGAYGLLVGWAETQPAGPDRRKDIAEAERARRACLRVGVDLNS